MKIFTSIIVSVLFIIPSFIFYSCEDNNSITDPPANNIKTLTMTHFGVDWSEGKAGSMDNQIPYEKIDGETIAWCEYGTGTNYYEQLIAYRSSMDKMYKVNSTDLNSTTSIDTSKWNSNLDCNNVKLKPGDIWVTEGRDGYVVFKVLEAAQDSASIAADHEWKVKVQYKFSQSLTFN